MPKQDPTPAPQRPPPPAPMNAAHPVAAEDLRIGDFITVVEVDMQYMPFSCDDAFDPPRRAARLAYLPDNAGWPLKVVTIGLPFVLVRWPSGRHGVVDLRTDRIVRLASTFGNKAFALLNPNRKDKKSRKKQKNKKKKHKS